MVRPLPQEMALILRRVNNFNEHQQNLSKNGGFIHDLTAGNTNRKYPIDLHRANMNAEGQRNAGGMPTHSSFPQMPYGERMDFPYSGDAQNSFEDLDSRRVPSHAGRQEVDQDDNQDSSYWEREQDQPQPRGQKNKRKTQPFHNE